MIAAYVDTSCLLAIAFNERAAGATGARLEEFEMLVSANLLEAEYRSGLQREGIDVDEDALGWITWVLPDRPLTPELKRVLDAGHMRGADLWHLASALYLAPVPRDLAFLTLDEKQRDVAEMLGFQSWRRPRVARIATTCGRLRLFLLSLPPFLPGPAPVRHVA